MGGSAPSLIRIRVYSGGLPGEGVGDEVSAGCIDRHHAPYIRRPGDAQGVIRSVLIIRNARDRGDGEDYLDLSAL